MTTTTVWIEMTSREPDCFEWQRPTRRGLPEYYLRACTERNDAERKYFHMCDYASPQECAAALAHLQTLDQQVDDAYDRWQAEQLAKLEAEKGTM